MSKQKPIPLEEQARSQREIIEKAISVKHQPAIPLPPINVLTRTLEALNILNAEYLAHAGHAYPKLVAKVRELSPNDPLLAELGEAAA